MSKDYYQILGVGRKASQPEIKKAFRKLAHQYHPDKKSGNEARFKEINEAYQALSDPKKREQYDRFGHAFESGGGANQGGWGYSNQGNSYGFHGFSDSFDLGDIFRELFKDAFRNRDQVISLPISFTQAALGATLDLGTMKGKVRAKIPAGIQSGDTIRIKGESGYGNGDLLIQVTVKTPTRLTQKQKELLKTLNL